MSNTDGRSSAIGTAPALDDSQSLHLRVKRGLAWSSASAVALRMGSLLIGIVLARLLTPADFGVYAIALTVQTVLITLTDLGMSADLVRSRDFDRRVPTVATIGCLSGVVLCLVMVISAPATASAMGSASAAPVVIVLSFTLFIASIGIAPYARLQRDFEQKKLFATSCLDFALSSVVTVGLVLAGTGPIALAIGRVVAQTGATAAQFYFAKMRPKFGFDRAVAGSALHYGLPIAGGNLLSWLLLGVDKVAIGRMSGEVALGIYVLAFNVASWPMTAIGQAIRSVSLAAFSQVRLARSDPRTDAPTTYHRIPRDRSLAVGVGYAWLAALPAGAMLAALSFPLVRLLYGDKWLASAAVLAALASFGVLRVLIDVAATYLLAMGASKPVLLIQIVWVVALIPAVILAARLAGGVGVGWAHVIIALGVVLPVYMIALHRSGADMRALGSVMWKPVLAAVPAFVVARILADRLPMDWLGVVVGGAAGTVLYVGLLIPWIKRLRVLRMSGAGGEGAGADQVEAAAERSSDQESSRAAFRVGGHGLH